MIAEYLCMAFIKMDTQKLRFFRSKNGKLKTKTAQYKRGGSFKDLGAAVNATPHGSPVEAGVPVRLPSSYHGTPPHARADLLSSLPEFQRSRNISGQPVLPINRQLVKSAGQSFRSPDKVSSRPGPLPTLPLWSAGVSGQPVFLIRLAGRPQGLW